MCGRHMLHSLFEYPTLGPHAPTEAIWNTGSRSARSQAKQSGAEQSGAAWSGAEQSTQRALTKRTTNEANYFSNSRRRYAMRCDTSTFTNFKQMTADESYFNDLAVAKNRLHTAQAKAQAQRQRQRRRRRAELSFCSRRRRRLFGQQQPK